MLKIIEDEAAFELAAMAVNRGIIAEPNYKKMVTQSRESGQAMTSVLFEKGVMDEFSLARFVAESYGLNFQEVQAEELSEEAQKKLAVDYIRTNNVIPFEVEGTTLKNAICDQSKLP